MLFLDARACTGDMIRATMTGIPSNLEDRRFTLALIAHPDSRWAMNEEFVESIFDQVRRHVPLRDRVLMLDPATPLPGDASPLPDEVGHVWIER